MALGPRHPRVKDPEFLAWAHRQPGQCCLCRQRRWEQLHHFGSGGMGSKGDDERVARVCLPCHTRARKEIAMRRDGDFETLAAFLADALDLMIKYKRELVARTLQRDDCPDDPGLKGDPNASCR